MTDIHDFIKCLHDIVDEHFPNTTRYMIDGGDFMKDVIMELRQGDKRFRYSLYELFNMSNNYEYTIEQFVKKWESMLQEE